MCWASSTEAMRKRMAEVARQAPGRLRGVGLRTVEQLHQSGVAVVVVDDDPDLRRARIIEGWGVTHIHRSAQLGDGLAEAGLDRASAVICVETNELATLEIAMRVREERPDVRLVVQMANPAVGRALGAPGKQVLGTVPVEADGSAHFRAPAGVPPEGPGDSRSGDPGAHQ